eukprot:g13931.t1
MTTASSAAAQGAALVPQGAEDPDAQHQQVSTKKNKNHCKAAKASVRKQHQKQKKGTMQGLTRAQIKKIHKAAVQASHPRGGSGGNGKFGGRSSLSPAAAGYVKLATSAEFLDAWQGSRRPFVPAAPVRDSALHVYGVSFCVSKDLQARTSPFAGGRMKKLEWLDDFSLNVVYANSAQLQKAVKKLLPESYQQFEYCNSGGVISDIDSVWRTTTEPVQGRDGCAPLQFRMCTEADVKLPGHHGSTHSAFYDCEKQKQQAVKEYLEEAGAQQKDMKMEGVEREGASASASSSTTVSGIAPAAEAAQEPRLRPALAAQKRARQEPDASVDAASPSAKKQAKEAVKLPQPVYRFLSENNIRHHKANVKYNYFACVAEVRRLEAAQQREEYAAAAAKLKEQGGGGSGGNDLPAPSCCDAGTAATAGDGGHAADHDVEMGEHPANREDEEEDDDGMLYPESYPPTPASSARTDASEPPLSSALSFPSSVATFSSWASGVTVVPKNHTSPMDGTTTDLVPASPWEVYMAKNGVGPGVSLTHALLWRVNGEEDTSAEIAPEKQSRSFFVLTLTAHKRGYLVDKGSLAKAVAAATGISVESVEKAKMGQVQSFFEKQLPPAVSTPFFTYSRHEPLTVLSGPGSAGFTAGKKGKGKGKSAGGKGGKKGRADLGKKGELSAAVAGGSGSSVGKKNSASGTTSTPARTSAVFTPGATSACHGFLVIADALFSPHNVKMHFDLGPTSVQVWSKCLRKVPNIRFASNLSCAVGEEGEGVAHPPTQGVGVKAGAGAKAGSGALLTEGSGRGSAVGSGSGCGSATASAQMKKSASVTDPALDHAAEKSDAAKAAEEIEARDVHVADDDDDDDDMWAAFAKLVDC